MMITIQKSKTTGLNPGDFAMVTKAQLFASSVQHINDVRKGFAFFKQLMDESVSLHDSDKLSDLDGFHSDFMTGFSQTDWWDRHLSLNRHHLTDDLGVPPDVNLIDVLDMIIDCVMASMSRSGSVYPIDVSPDLLKRAFDNTVELLKAEVAVED